MIATKSSDKITMSQPELIQLKKLSQQVAKVHTLKMLVLFGSRARGDDHTKSDWDFAILYDDDQNLEQGYSQLKIYTTLANIFQISSEKIDVVNLKNCSPLIAFHIAKDGKAIYEQTAGEFIKFQMKAWKIYADTQKFRNLQEENIKFWLQKWRR